MIDISKEKKRLLPLYVQKRCPGSNENNCDKEVCTCSLLATHAAFVNTILPKGYRQFTIKDFTGIIDQDKKLDAKTTIYAKNKVIQYCYGDLSLKEVSKMSEVELTERSLLGSRLDNGQSIVIHGDSSRELGMTEDRFSKVVREIPLGRTFIASIITKQAILLKIHKDHYMKNFDWVDFAELTQVLKGSTDDDKFATSYYEDCDWLVIDDISASGLMASSAQKSWVESMYNAFFSYRRKNNKTTVFVFRFDVNRRRSELEAAYGNALIKTIDDPQTTVIGLTTEKADNV